MLKRTKCWSISAVSGGVAEWYSHFRANQCPSLLLSYHAGGLRLCVWMLMVSIECLKGVHTRKYMASICCSDEGNDKTSRVRYLWNRFRRFGSCIAGRSWTGAASVYWIVNFSCILKCQEITYNTLCAPTLKTPSPLTAIKRLKNVFIDAFCFFLPNAPRFYRVITIAREEAARDRCISFKL